MIDARAAAAAAANTAAVEKRSRTEELPGQTETNFTTDPTSHQ